MGRTPIDQTKATHITEHIEMTSTQSDLFAQPKTRRGRPSKAQPTPTRTLPLPTLELMAQLAGAGCVDHGHWTSIDEAAEVFAHHARAQGGCSDCAPFDGPCPENPLQVAQMLIGMFGLLGVTGKFDAGYDFEFQRLARMLARDVRDFGPKPHQATKSGRRATKSGK